MVRAPREGGLPTSDAARASLAFAPHAGLLRPACSRTRQTPWSVFQDGPLGAAVPASLTYARERKRPRCPRANGRRVPGPRPPGGHRGAHLPAPSKGGAGLPTPRPPRRRPARWPATMKRTRGPSLRPAQTLPPCRPMRADAGRPARMDGATREDAGNGPRGAFDRAPQPLRQPSLIAGHPGGLETGGPRALPSRRFQALLTLFSESFSSFPRGTCSLSVSRPYLALGGAYHPLGAAFPSSPTLGASDVALRPGIPLASRTGLSPSAAPRPRGSREACRGGPPRR
jgi:hypothetical protein